MAYLVKMFILFAIIGLAIPARINVEDLDYNSLLGLLTEIKQGESVKESQSTHPIVTENKRTFAVGKPSISSMLAPNIEILRLVEAFMKLKGEMASRVNLVISDNWDIIKSVFLMLLGKVSSLHSFTLKGISVIRQILEFAVSVLATWKI